MKNIRIFLTVATALVFFGCEQNEREIFDVNGGQTLAAFENNTSNLEVLINEDGIDSITVGYTTLSNQARTINVSVDPASTANSENYTIANPQVSIPAGEFTAEIIINATDVSVAVETKSIILNIASVSNGTISEDSKTHIISIFQICPVPEDFLVGQYTIEDVTATIGPGNGTTNIGPATVNIEIGESATQRVFNAPVYPAFLGTQPITLNLICNNFVFGELTLGLTCDGSTLITFSTAGAQNSTYDTANELDEYIITYTEDRDGSCGGPFISSFKLTKI